MYSDGIEARVLGFIRARSLLSPGDVVVTGVSGGPDSLCLLHALHRLQPQLQVSIHVAHLNHMLRGDDAKDEREFVALQAAGLELPFTSAETDVAAYADASSMGLEEAARRARYAFLHEVACQVGATCVATGHTRDDSVETVLMNIVRGAGNRGLRGLDAASVVPIGPGSDMVKLVRPLLELSRRDTEAYCSVLGLQPRIDESNACIDFARNRVRHELLPLLRDLNPSVDDAVLRLAEAVRQDHDLLEERAAELFTRCAIVGESHVYLDTGLFAAAPPALQMRLVQRTYEILVGSLQDLTMAHIRAVQSLAVGQGGKQTRVPHGVTWRKEGKYLLAFAPCADPSTVMAMPQEPVPLTIPGDTVVGEWCFTTDVGMSAPDMPTSHTVAVLDAERTGTRVLVRRRRSGDRMQPCGMQGQKKVQDLMVDCKIPAVARDGVPVVCAGETIAWIVGCRVDERFKATPSTRMFLHLSCHRI